MPHFFIPKESKNAPLLTKALFQSVISDNKQRSLTYTRWSEKATIVAFDESSETYDIVISTISYSADSAAVNKVSRTIRNVKSIIPISVYTFKPGETVLIGYVSERRESPVILGLKSAKSNKTVTVVNIDPVTPDLQILIRETLEDVTDNEEIAVTCTDIGVTGTMDLNLEIKNAVGEVTWGWDVTQCTTGTTPSVNTVTSVNPSGMNDRYVNFHKGTATSVLGSTHPCLALVVCDRAQVDFVGGGCTKISQHNFYNGDGMTISTLTDSCIYAFGGSCTGCEAISCVVCDEFVSGDGCPHCYTENVTPCIGDPASVPLLCSADNWLKRGYQRGNGAYQYTGGAMDTVLSTVEQQLNQSLCCVCALVDGSFVTATDEAGHSWTAQLRLEIDPSYPLFQSFTC